MKTKIIISLRPVSVSRGSSVARVKNKPAPGVTPDLEAQAPEDAEPEVDEETGEAVVPAPKAKGKPALEVPKKSVTPEAAEPDVVDPRKTQQQLLLKRLSRVKRAYKRARHASPATPPDDLEALKIEYRSVLREYHTRFPDPDADVEK